MLRCSVFLLLMIVVLLSKGGLMGPSPSPSPWWSLTDEKVAAIREIGERITRSMKPEVDPCVDYYDYMCGKFNRTEFEVKRVASTKRLEMNLENIFAKPDKLQAEIKLENFLISCKNRDKENVAEFVKNFNILESVGGWPALNPNWNGDKFDLATAISEMQSYTMTVVIQMNFEAEDEKTRFLRISPKRIRPTTTPKQISRMKDLLKESGINDIDSVAKDCMDFEKEYVKAFRGSGDPRMKTDIKTLKEKIPEMDWEAMIKTISGRELQDNFPVWLDSLSTLKRLIEIVKQQPPKVTMNYIFFNFIDRVHQKSVANCPEKTFDYFDPVLARHFVKSYYNEEYKNFFSGMMYSLVKTLSENSLQMFDGAETEDIMKSIQTIVDEEYLPHLADNVLEKEYEGLTVVPDKFYENSFKLRHHTMKHAYDYFFNERDDVALAIGHTIPYVITQSLYKCHNLPTPIILDCLSNDLVETIVGLHRHRQDYSDQFRECMKDQVGGSTSFDNSDLFAIERTHIYANSYDDWSKQNEDIMQKENEIWSDYGLTSKRVLLSKNMRLLCGLEDDNDETTRKVILSNFRNLDDFAEAYNCQEGTPMNPKEKCNIA